MTSDKPLPSPREPHHFARILLLQAVPDSYLSICCPSMYLFASFSSLEMIFKVFLVIALSGYCILLSTMQNYYRPIPFPPFPVHFLPQLFDNRLTLRSLRHVNPTTFYHLCNLLWFCFLAKNNTAQTSDFRAISTTLSQLRKMSLVTFICIDIFHLMF